MKLWGKCVVVLWMIAGVGVLLLEDHAVWGQSLEADMLTICHGGQDNTVPATKEDTRDAFTGGGKIYSSLETSNLRLAGIDLAEYDYGEVYRYVLVNSYMLFVLGRTNSDEITLSAITLDDQRLTQVAQYPVLKGFFPLTNVKFTVFSMHKLKPTQLYVMITYTENESGMEVKLTSTNIEVFRLEPDNSYTLINKERIEETNIGTEDNSDPQYTYKHLAYNYTPEDAGKIRPATRNKTKVFLSDVNDDGYIDLLVWEQIYLSRTLEDKEADEFVFEREEIHTMCFKSEEMAFSSLILLRNFTDDTKEL